MENNRVKKALNYTLSSLYVSDAEASTLLAQAKGGKKVKKKLSVAFVMMMILVAITITALAVITIREVGQQVAENEKRQGYYINWTLEQKKKLISSLIELKYMDKSEESSTLSNNKVDDQAAHQIANELIAKFTGKNASEVNFLSIMQVPMGPVDKWTYEEKAWYSKLMRDVGIEGDGITQFVEPSGKINEQEAIRIARHEVAAGYKVDESILDSYLVSVDFEIPEAAEPGSKQAYWHVQFAAPQNMSEEERLFILFPVYVHPETGKLLRSVDEILNTRLPNPRPSNEVYRAIHNLEVEAGELPFRLWSIELKAKYSQMVNPLVEKIVDSGDMEPLTLDGKLDIETLARSEYTYGLPDNKSLTQEKAFELAITAMHEEFNVDEATINLYRDNIVYYDISDTEHPLWRFVFSGSSLDWLKLRGGINNLLAKMSFRIEVNAHTGEVESTEKFDFKPHGYSMESELRWY